MTLTYDQLIEKTRTRGKGFLLRTPSYEKGEVYDALHDAIRHVFHVTKQSGTSATLSLVADTRDYTISSAIATDVDAIEYIHIDTGEIVPRTLRRFQEEIFFDVDDEDDITSGTPEFYRILGNTTLRVYPTPNQAFSATVFYSKKIAPDFYTTAIGATNLPLPEEYIESVIYEALASLSENVGDFKRSDRYLMKANMKFNEAQENRTVHAYSHIDYHEPR